MKYEFRKIVHLFSLYRKSFKLRTTRKGHRWNSHDLYESSFCWTCTTDTYSRTNHKNKANKSQLVDNFYFTPITGDTPPCLRGQATWNEVIPGFLSLPPSASALVWFLRVMYDCIIPVADRRLSGNGMVLQHGQPGAAVCLLGLGAGWGFMAVRCLHWPLWSGIISFDLFSPVESGLGRVGLRLSETREIFHTHAKTSHDFWDFSFSSDCSRFHTCCWYPFVIFLKIESCQNK